MSLQKRNINLLKRKTNRSQRNHGTAGDPDSEAKLQIASTQREKSFSCTVTWFLRRKKWISHREIPSQERKMSFSHRELFVERRKLSSVRRKIIRTEREIVRPRAIVAEAWSNKALPGTKSLATGQAAGL